MKRDTYQLKHREEVPEVCITPQKPIKTKGIAKRYVILRASEFKCHYCGTKLTMDDLTIDHVIPRANGGGNENENLVASCQECNQLKGTIPYKIFVEAMKSGRVDELVNDHKKLTDAAARESVRSKSMHSKSMARNLANRASIIRAIAKHLEKDQIDPDMLDELDLHIDALQQLKDTYVDFLCHQGPDLWTN